MLKVEHITTGYGKKQVLTDVSFSVDKGDVVLLSGGNGSGKSTVLKTIYGLLKPWAADGKVFFEERNITALPVSEMIRLGIVYMPQKKNVFEDFTVEENLLTSAGIYPKKEAEERVQKVFYMLPVLKNMRKRTPFNMSGGERQLLAFGNVLVHSPKLALLDEPFAGVDAGNSEVFKGCIVDLKKEGVTFVVVEHKRQLLEGVVGREVELELGEVKR
ncbi:MAG: ATP-binding cassette domain-containing protein [Fibromonadaceae bacterium]|jgi:branched-chain amino acid transport system ATP-binding protein|nr:ATP-binding cassette domain-containing protein [Fibromonadaceae bacterium]